MLKKLLDIQTSDFYLRKDGAFCRCDGNIKKLDFALDIPSLLSDLGLENRLKYEMEQDFSFEFEGVFMRFHLFLTRGDFGLNIRMLPKSLPTLDSRYNYFLSLLKSRQSGLFLISGSTGSGKTTTANCMLDFINSNLCSHIICIEDPIEYRHFSKNSVFTYREISSDTKSFESGIISALRLDPDVIFVGELREKGAIKSALLAAQTGHLVIATIHGSDAQNTLLRFIGVFDDRELAALEVSQSIFGVITQRRDEKNRIICEMLSPSDAVRNLIKERKFNQLESQIEISSRLGMIGFNDARNFAI